MSKLFVTGDTHGNSAGEFSRFNVKNFPEQKSLTKDDFVLIAGDFGCVWNDSSEERYWLDWLEAKPFTTLFVDGNHENHARLAEFPVEEWNGGKVHFIRPSVIHLMRGQVFEDIAGQRVFAMGGAASHDIKDGILDPAAPDFKRKYRSLRRAGALFRVNGTSWWKEELPSQDEYVQAESNLNACGRKVDLIITHCAPSSVSDVISGGMYQHDALTDYFEILQRTAQYRLWVFGHYHDNRMIQSQFMLLYDQIQEVF